MREVLGGVLSKGLNFVPVAKRTDEFSVKQDV